MTRASGTTTNASVKGKKFGSHSGGALLKEKDTRRARKKAKTMKRKMKSEKGEKK